MHYKYDHAGRRILEHKDSSGQRTRHFFNGLSEEVRKVSLGTHADDSFAYTVHDDGSASGWNVGYGTPGHMMQSVYDSERYSDVTELDHPSTCGVAYDFHFGGEPQRALSLWLNPGPCGGNVAVYVNTSAGNKWIFMQRGTGTDHYDGSNFYVYLGNHQAMTTGKWWRVERDLGQVVYDLSSAVGPAITYNQAWYMRLAGRQHRIDDVRFSNSATAETNHLAGGSIGHILRHRRTDAATGALAEEWFHYDQVGSVVAVSGDTGAKERLRYADAFGNAINPLTGLWKGESGWGHNSKARDDGTGLTYMYQRWYDSQLGMFASQAPWPPTMEHQYGFAGTAPANLVDPNGEFFQYVMVGLAVVGAIYAYYAFERSGEDCEGVDNLASRCEQLALAGEFTAECQSFYDNAPDHVYSDAAYKGAEFANSVNTVASKAIGPAPGSGGLGYGSPGLPRNSMRMNAAQNRSEGGPGCSVFAQQ